MAGWRVDDAGDDNRIRYVAQGMKVANPVSGDWDDWVDQDGKDLGHARTMSRL